jgi:hypothetical protein
MSWAERRERKAMTDRSHPLSLTRQVRLLDLSRSSLYYQPASVTGDDLTMMAAIDEIHLMLPIYGARRIRDELRDRGFAVGRDQPAEPGNTNLKGVFIPIHATIWRHS